MPNDKWKNYTFKAKCTIQNTGRKQISQVEVLLQALRSWDGRLCQWTKCYNKFFKYIIKLSIYSFSWCICPFGWIYFIDHYETYSVFQQVEFYLYINYFFLQFYVLNIYTKCLLEKLSHQSVHSETYNTCVICLWCIELQYKNIF